MSRAFTIEAIFKAIDHFTAPMARMSSNVSKFSQSAERAMGNVAKSTDSMIRGIERGALKVAAVGASVGVLGKGIIDVGAEFDSTMVKAVAKLDPALKRGTAGYERMKQLAKDIGAQTEYNALGAAKGIDAYASAGFNEKQILSALPVTVDFGTIAEVPDLGRAAEMITGALSAFDMLSQDTEQLGKNVTRVSDIVAKTVIASSAGPADLAEAIARAGTITTQAGQKPETFLAMAGILSPLEKGEKAGTTIKNILDPFTSDGKDKSGKLLKSIGVKTLDAKGDMRDVLDILEDIGKATEKMGSGTKTGFLKKLFGEVPAAGAMKLLQDPSAIKKMRAEIEGAAGASAQLASAFRDTVTGDMDALSSAIDDVKLSIFDLNNGPLRDVLQSMTKWVAANKDMIIDRVQATIKWLSEHFDDIVSWGSKIGGTIAAIYAINGAAKVVGGAFEAVGLVWGGLKKAWEFAPYLWKAVSMAGQAAMFALRLAVVGVIETVAFLAANPIALLIIAIIAAAAAVYYYWDPIKAFFVVLGQGIVETWASVTESLGGMWTGAVDALMSAWEPVKSFFTGLWDGVVSTFNGALESIMSGIRSATSALGGLFGDGAPVGASGAPSSRGTGVNSVSNDILRRELSETRSSYSETKRTEVVIRDETGRAQINHSRPRVRAPAGFRSGEL